MVPDLGSRLLIALFFAMTGNDFRFSTDFILGLILGQLQTDKRILKVGDFVE
jgi:hypothetical protein